MLGIALSTFAVPRSAGAAPVGVMTICAGQAVPAGYLVTAFSTTAACGTARMASYNTMTIRAYAGLRAIATCAPNANIPRGYLITALSTTAACRGGQAGLAPWNSITLSAYEGLATLNARMPLASPPAGYVITRQLRVATCSPAPGMNAVTLKRL